LAADSIGAILLAAAVGAGVLAVAEGHSWGWTSGPVAGLTALAIVLGGLAARRPAGRLLDSRLLASPGARAANTATVLGAAGFFGYTLLNALYLTDVWHYSVLKAGLALTPGPIVATLVAIAAARLVTRHGPRPVVIPGALIWAAAVLWFS